MRRAVVALFVGIAASADAATFIVTSVADSGAGTLRQAILDANANAGADRIIFDIPGGFAHTITPLSALPAITEAVTIDGPTQPGFTGSPLIELNGSSTPASAGITISTSNAVVRSLAINRFTNGISIQTAGSGNVVAGCYIGTDVTGASALANSNDGILITDSASNTIGGTTAADRNVISGNGSRGIEIATTGTAGRSNVIEGNYIGLDAAGTAAIANGAEGIFISTTGNTVGGTVSGSGNVVSGNNHDGIGINASGDTVEGNFLGTNAAGTAAIPNANSGVAVFGAGNLIANNLASGNKTFGIAIVGPQSGNVIQGNLVGTNAAGTAAVPNQSTGIVLILASGNPTGPSNTLVGGTTAAARNVVSGNGGDGITIAGGANGNTVEGNYFGTDITGTAPLGNAFDAVNLGGANNIIGGTTAAARNVISGNTNINAGGMSLNGAAATGNLVEGNYIGVDVNGTVAMPNTDYGIGIFGGVNNTISGNVIADNAAAGVEVNSGTGNAIEGNSMFGNTGLGIDLDPAGVTANDAGDGDTGPNNLQNFPVLTQAQSIGSATVIQGTLNSTPSTSFRIEFFANASCDPSGNGEGQQFLGFMNVTTDAGGNAAFTFSAPVAASGVATATATPPSGDTSEFSACLAINTTAPAISINDVSVTEGNSGTTPATLTVSLSAPSLFVTTVSYATADVTATAPADYAAASGVATFPAGTTTQTISVNVVGDTIDEPNETFQVNLSGAMNATIADAQGIGTIIDDDPAPSLSINNVTQAEGNSGTTSFVFTVTLSAPSGQTVTVNYATANGSATAGSDYNPVNGTLTFNPGTTTQTITVPVIGDTALEPDETFTVNLTSPVNATIATATGTGTILNDDLGTADVSISKVAIGTQFFQTLNATFTITASNLGPDPATAVTTVDPLPAGMTFVSAVPSQGSCSGTAVVTCSLGTLASGASATVTLTVNLTASGPLTNTASVSAAQADGNGGNNSASAAINAQNAAAIPLLDDRFRIALIVALAALAFGALSRRV